jgi:HAD superfamily hydrolase (TIGR01509 family)
MIFDLDGTLVQTERLKAASYARAAVELCPIEITEQEVIEAFKDVVGLSRQEVASTLVRRFDLEKAARARMQEFGVTTSWQAYVQLRLQYYDEMLADPETLVQNQWPHNVALLEKARLTGCKTALATMSRCSQAQRVLRELDLVGAFDFVATRDDVEHGKPDPEIYQLVARELGFPPDQCLVIEDSPSGVRAALTAGMWCIAVATPFTRQRLYDEGSLDERWVVDDPDNLMVTVETMLNEREESQTAGSG